ncbi:neuronal pentraxin receptor-like [Hemitrygon akajei]|uniref:neuronal pentraxin receptor-like n=1 Tax=Hemitrygon akajei TaxID=2704970 RepID=UPI003BF96BC4
MLAFLGAVICIIASIAPGSPGSVPGAENEAGALLATQSGAGAARGADTGRAGVPAPTPSQGTAIDPGAGKASVSSGLGYGSDSLMGTASRFLCLPLAQDCPSPSIREDLLLLRSTADHLRQMVTQQEKQIASDQQTIRELTSKLSQCENGQELSFFQNNPEEYAWDLGRNSLEDGTEESDWTVLDLEQTIHSLKDSIENLESDVSSCFKQRPVIPVSAKNMAICLNAYRPEALTSAVMKCFERLVMEAHQLVAEKRLRSSTADAISLALHSPLSLTGSKPSVSDSDQSIDLSKRACSAC